MQGDTTRRHWRAWEGQYRPCVNLGWGWGGRKGLGAACLGTEESKRVDGTVGHESRKAGE